MARTKVTSKFDIRAYVNRFMTPKEEAAIGDTITDMAKEMIAGGQSPVRGEGRFAGYKAAERAKSAKKIAKALSGERKAMAKEKARQFELEGYPYNVMDEYPEKKVRPVNLELSGDMLDALDWRRSRANVITWGLHSPGKEILDRAQAINDGTDKMAKRPFIPDKPGQEFAARIVRAIKDIYSKRIGSIIKSSNRKTA